MSPSSFNRTVIFTFLGCVACTYLISLYRVKPSELQVQSQFPLCTILPSSIEYVLEQQSKFVGDRNMYWPKHSEIKIFIMDGKEEARKKVLRYATEWASLTGLVFRRVYSGSTASIRISFNCNGYNSLIGLQALDPDYKDKATMCLQGLDQSNDEELFKRTVLHEFGHVMGMLHELQNPIVKIPWNLPKLYAYYKNTYGWDAAMVDQWILSPVDEDTVDYSEFDQSSIMIYAVPDSLTDGKYSFTWPQTLSETDREKIKFYYNQN